MEVKVLEKAGGRRVLLHLKGMGLEAVNALRRAILSDLPCFAIEEVDFFENNSAMFNEYLANRLALIPLTFEESSAEDARIPLSLNAEGPCMVYSRDLKSSDEAIRVFNENIPVIKLAAGQKLRFEAVAVKGTAKAHAKFQCALASYYFYPELKKNSSTSWETLLKHVPRDLVSREGKLADCAKADLVEEYAQETRGDLEVKFKDNEFVFLVESYNNLEPMQHFENALNLLQSKIGKIEDSEELK